MTNIKSVSESRKAVATKVAENYFGVSTETINNIVNKFVRIAVRDENKPYCSSIVETYTAGAEKYRITIEGAYNDLQNGGTKKTDYCFANIRFEIKGSNGLYAPYGSEWVKVNGVTADAFEQMIFDTIMVYYLEMAEDMRHESIDANRAIEDAYEEAVVVPMQELVAGAQESVDAIVTDFGIIAKKTKLDIFAKKQCLVRIKDICEQCLVDCGKISGCEMVWDDGFHPSLEGLKNLAVENISDLENLIDTLDYDIAETDAPLGLDEEDMEFINNGGCYCFDTYPWYLWQDMREFASTYYHYAYCA